MVKQFEFLNIRVSYLSLILNGFALAFIYFVPALSHMFHLPLYLLEPMRLMLVLAMVHTNRQNAYFLAVSLPLFSFLVSAHPVFPKMMLITIELILNVSFFYLVLNRTGRAFAAMVASIILSKIIYYILKYTLISFLVIQSGLFSTSIGIQVLTTMIFSGYAWFILRRKQIADAN